MKKIFVIIVVVLFQAANINAQDESYLSFLKTAKIISESFEDELDLEIVRLEFDNLSTTVRSKEVLRNMSDSYDYYVLAAPVDDAISKLSFRINDEEGNFVANSEEYTEEDGITTYLALVQPDKWQQFTITMNADAFKSGELTGTYMLIIAHTAACTMSEKCETYYWKKEKKFVYQYTNYTESCFIIQGSTLIEKTGDRRVEYTLEKIDDQPENAVMMSATDGKGNKYLLMIKSDTNTLWLLNLETDYVKVYYLTE